MVGVKARHGPHHGAQKSTTTGLAEARTFCWKLAWVNLTMLVLESCSAEALSTCAQPAVHQATKAAVPMANQILLFMILAVFESAKTSKRCRVSPGLQARESFISWNWSHCHSNLTTRLPQLSP